MMHIGHQYRAGIPRYASVDFFYSSGVPANWFFWGFIHIAGMPINFAPDTFKSPAVAYDDLTARFQWTFSMMGDDGNPYGLVSSDGLVAGTPDRSWVGLLTDGFGNSLSWEARYRPFDILAWDNETNVGPADCIFATTGFMDPDFRLQRRPVRYSEE